MKNKQNMKNKVEHILRASDNPHTTMQNVMTEMTSVIAKNNKEGYKVVSTDFVKYEHNGQLNINAIIVFEKF